MCAGPDRMSEELLLDYSAGRLNPAQMAQINSHTLTCAACESLVLAQTTVWEAMDTWEPVAVSNDFNRSLWRKIDGLDSLPWYQKLADSLRLGSWKPALSVTTALVLVATGFVFDHRARLSELSPAMVAAADVEQVEQSLEDIQLLGQLNMVAMNTQQPLGHL